MTKTTQSQFKIALLIASPHGELMGPVNDANQMEQALSGLQFEIMRCCGEDVTQQGILGNWRSLNARLREFEAINPKVEATAIIYCSGHGGLARPPKDGKNFGREYQFLVPRDFDQGNDDFKGVAFSISRLPSF